MTVLNPTEIERRTTDSEATRESGVEDLGWTSTKRSSVGTVPFTAQLRGKQPITV